MKRLVIWGAGGHSKVIAEAIQQSLEYQIAGYVIDEASINSDEATNNGLDGVARYTSYDEAVDHLRHAKESLIIGFGDAVARKKLIARLSDESIQFASVIHRGAQVLGGASVADGCFIAAGSVVGVQARLASHCIVNTAASVDHDCVLAENVQLGPGARLGGGVRIGAHSFIGMNACVAPHVNIGANAIVGAGSVVLSDVPDSVLVAGSPARVRRKTDA